MPVAKSAKKATPASPPERKPWKKKSPFEVVLEQGEKLKAKITEMEEDLKRKRRELEKFEEVRKVLESA